MERVFIRVNGIVQGVGFRPFIHKTVRDMALSGYIKNTSSGVELELEGERAALEDFVRSLPDKAPKLAVIESVTAEYSSELAGFSGFEIRSSKTEAKRSTLLSPDVCICPDCLRELFDPRDRRYRYPFINCTNCGPRFTIIKDIPYDRAKTSMSAFPMCPDCDAEYHDIENRRYHAQPDCCPDCGPHCFFLDADGVPIAGDAIELARERIKRGEIIAVKGLGGMHLACLPSEAAKLRARKHRDEKPFALMCRDADCARELCFVSEDEERVLTGFRRPIVLLRKRVKAADAVSENGYIGIMLPYTPLHYLLFGDDISTLIMTSANLSDTPIMFDNAEAVEKLSGIADGFLLHNRDIQTRCDDSLCCVLGGSEYFLRRSRGYVPFPVPVHRECGGILACGAEQKASFALSRGDQVFMSQHIGDLKNMETFENYSAQISYFKRLFDIDPTVVVCDMHPDYLSTLYASEYAAREGVKLVPVQHHHAHMASCMADNGLDKPVIGLIWDGTGYGTDGTVWGGECLIGDYGGFERFGSIRPIPLIGGDRVTVETDRVAYALMREAGCLEETNAQYDTMLDNGLNCPLSSGMGRLFDGLAAMLGIKTRCTYEGQGAVLLEAAAEDTSAEYPAPLSGTPLRFDWREMLRLVKRDTDAGIPVGEIAGRFMNTLITAAVRMCAAAREHSGVNDVVLSGGTFQNMYIMQRLPGRLEREGFAVFRHRRVSTNDEGLSLGQLMIAASREEGQDVSRGSFEID